MTANQYISWAAASLWFLAWAFVAFGFGLTWLPVWIAGLTFVLTMTRGHYLDQSR